MIRKRDIYPSNFLEQLYFSATALFFLALAESEKAAAESEMPKRLSSKFC
ncbi:MULTISPECIES: hypothetical protein [unclassified Nostoc]|nr:hypothetical protein [Nostoc sp. DedQUE03]MDZ7974375.1 hypothetical protein [Nostoc sp. DedQUE03]MDZ8047747.1 hypothetical protein [Nostoc sp. DedQUE02]